MVGAGGFADADDFAGADGFADAGSFADVDDFTDLGVFAGDDHDGFADADDLASLLLLHLLPLATASVPLWVAIPSC